MSEGIKETVQAILSNPKVATAITASTMYQTWWMEWGNPLFDALATIAGFILVVIMIMLQWLNLKDKLRKNKDRDEAESNDKKITSTKTEDNQ